MWLPFDKLRVTTVEQLLKVVYAESITHIESFDCGRAVVECIVPDEIYGAGV